MGTHASFATWPLLLPFVVGVVTAIFAEPVRRWIFRPVLKVSFQPKTCIISTPSEITSLGQKTESEGRWVRVRVCTRNMWLKSRLAKGCRAHLVKVEIQEKDQFRPTNFVDTLRLRWSSQLSDEAAKPIDVPSDVAQFVDVISTDRSNPGGYALQTTLVPFYCRALFDQRPKTLRLTILVTSDDAKAARARFIFQWKGAWDTFEALPD